MKTQKLLSMGLLLLASCATVPPMPEAGARLRLADAGIELWPPGVEADAYKPPYSYLKQDGKGQFRLYVRSDSLTNVSVLSAIPISDLALDCPKLADLTALSQLPLKKLSLTCHPDADFSFARGKDLRSLGIAYMPVRDLSVFKGMPLEELWFNPYIVTNGLDLVATSPRLDYIVTCTCDDNRQSWNRKAFLAKQKVWGFRPDSAGEPPTVAAIQTEPLSLCMTTYSGYTTAREWEFTVQTNREAVLTVDDCGSSAKRTKSMRLSAEQFAALRKTIAENSFFALEASYGDNIIDASSRVLSVRVGVYQRTILIRDFNNRLVANDSQLESAKQLLKIWGTLVSLANLSKDCLNWTEDDAKVLEWKAPNHGTEPIR